MKHICNKRLAFRQNFVAFVCKFVMFRFFLVLMWMGVFFPPRVFLDKKILRVRLLLIST